MHFFTEPSSLIEQQLSNAYGPLLNTFSVSATFNVSSVAKIFACQDAMMIIQPYVDITTGNINNDLVNVILKPVQGLKIPFSSVKYYIYKGVAKSSFIDGIAIVPDSSTDKTEFITKFWQRWNQYKIDTNQPGLTDPTPQSFGFDLSLADTILLEEIYNSAESNNNVINDLQAIKVSEGEWIGNILTTNEFNFEVIIDIDHLVLDLGYVKKSKHIIDIDGLPSSTPQELFIIKAEKEKILNYIDPASLFGMYYDMGVKISTYSGATKNTVTKYKEDIYLEILNKFYTKNNVYMDIRSERGYSYNYYDNYDFVTIEGGGTKHQNIQFKGYSDSNYLSEIYGWPTGVLSPDLSIWPIIIYTFDDDRINLKLRIDDNAKPLLFIEDYNLMGGINSKKFLTDPELLQNSVDGWTDVITLSVPVVEVNNEKKNIAYHIKLQYFRQEDNPASPNTVLRSENYLDSAFGGIHMPALNIPTAFQHIKNSKYNFVNGGSFSYVADNGIYQDDTLILFYADNIYPLISSGSVFPKVDINKVSYNPIVSSPLFRQDLLFNKWGITEGSTTIDILEIVGYNKTTQQATPTEDLLFLGLTKTELNTLDGLTGISDLHHKYFLFEEVFDASGNPLKDSITNTVYKKFKLKVQGLDESGEVQIVEPVAGNEIYIYGSSHYMLCSKDFAAAANIDRLLPDPGTFTEFQNSKHIQYDANDLMVTSLFPTGNINLDDSGLTFFPSSPRTSKIDAGLNGEFYYPVDSPGSSEISIRYSQFPLIVICHGNGQRYSDYKELSTHLSKNGFIVLSISCLREYPGHIFQPLIFDATTLLSIYNIDFFISIRTPAFPANYHIVHPDFDDPTRTYADTIYVYNNDPGTPINSEYGYQKLTVLTGIYDQTSSPELYTITSERLLSWEKGIDFDIILDSSGNPEKINFLFKVGTHGMSILGRSNMIYPHIQIIRKYFEDKGWGNKIENRIGLIGHSRGAEAVVRCATDISDSTLIQRVDITASPDPRTGPDLWKYVPIDLFDIKAVISLAPTDACKDKINQLDEEIPYYILYGSMEGDVVGYRNRNDITTPGTFHNRTSGFSIYDRTLNDTEKSMSFVYGATHNGFITNNSDYPSTPFDSAKQKLIALAYINGFMRTYLKSENIWRAIFYGDYIPKSTMSDKIYPQYQNMATPPLPSSKWLINFETWGTSPDIKFNGASLPLSNISEDDLILLDTHTPHDTIGIKITIPSSSVNTLTFEIATGGKDISSYDFISFRIGHVVDIVSGSYIDLSKIEVKLNSIGSSGYQRVLNKVIPEPDLRPIFRGMQLTKSAMNTVRLVLSDFNINGVDLTKVTSLELIFPSHTRDYEVLMDDIEFTN